MGKNIVFLADGSGNSGQAGKETNVFKLSKMVDTSNPSKQIAKYIVGVGTESNFLQAKFNFFTGQGITKNILAGYRYLSETYQPGDRIFLFGFSRGAATIRSLTGLINDVGLLPVERLDKMDDAYEIYRLTDKAERDQKALQFIEANKSYKPEIYFVGVWDTVAAIGLQVPFLNQVVNLFQKIQHKFHNFTLVPLVRHARHAIAIDEKRFFFSPVLWDSQTDPHQTLKQVWFAGVHKNVGGGWIEDHALSDIALQWMLDEAIPTGLRIDPKHLVRISPDAMGKKLRQNFFVFNPLISKNRSWNSTTQGKPMIHDSVLERSQKDPGYRPWILKESYDIFEHKLHEVLAHVD